MKAKDSKAVFHAVSTSSAYEKGVLTGIASIGGGSFRRADGGAAAAAKALRGTPARDGYRMPAEWEPHEATWLTWPRKNCASFPGKFGPVPARIQSEVPCWPLGGQSPTWRPRAGFATAGTTTSRGAP